MRVFTENLAWLSHHLDACQHVLPLHLVEKDVELLRVEGFQEPTGLSAQRHSYRHAFGALAPLARQIDRIERELMRVESLRSALARPQTGYGGLALSLGASVLVNPMFIVGAAQQAHSMASAESK